MVTLLTDDRSKLVTDTWVKATWEEFLAASKDSELEKTRCYYDSGSMRIETMSVGSGHGQDNSLMTQVVNLYAIVNNLRLKSFTNTSFSKEGERESQPDMAFYIGDDIPKPFSPKGTEAVDLHRYGVPTLTIEVASTSLNDDVGRKRLLYERLNVQEYWIVDVLGMTILAFDISNLGSRQIQVSQVLPGLLMKTIEEALRRSQTEDDTEINQWLIQVLRQG